MRFRAGCMMVRAALASLVLMMVMGTAQAAAKLSAADYSEITQLYHAYALALDTDDGAALAATFAPGGTVSSYQSKQRPEPVAALLKRMGADTPKDVPPREHMVSLVHLIPTAGGAKGTCYGIVNMSLAADGQFSGTPEFYSDILVKTRAGWRFKSRQIFTAGEDY
jgi:hypothetical protein